MAGFDAIYAKACEILAEIGQALDQETGVPVAPLKLAAQGLMAAIQADPDRVEPYILLAGIFLCLEQRQLVEKYVLLAEQRQPDFPELQRLKQHLLMPAALRKTQPARRIAAEAIQSVQRLQGGDKPAAPPGGHALRRFFGPILPLLATPEDLRQWVAASFGHALDADAAFELYQLVIGEHPASAREQMQHLQRLLSAIRPEFGQQPSQFALELSRSGPGVLRQMYLLLRPFAEAYPRPEDLQRALEAGFQTQPDASGVAVLHRLMHWPAPDYELLAAPRDTLLSLQATLQSLLPGSSEQLDLQPFLDQLRLQATA